MKNKLAIIAATLSFSCGAVDETTLIEVPGQEGRIDGSVWEDGAFNDESIKAEFCETYSHYNLWFCYPVGTSTQAWKSAEYHGIVQDADGTCFGPNSTSRHCRFQGQLKLRLKIGSTGCFQGPASGPSILQEQAMIEGYRDGALLWNGVAPNVAVVLSGSFSVASYTPVFLDCSCTHEDELAHGGLGPSMFKTVVNNLPTGQHGGFNPISARVSDAGTLAMNSKRLWSHIKLHCGQSPTTTQIKAVAKYVGLHETGHVLGFDHFNRGGNVMNPFTPNGCQPSLSIRQEFKDALSDFENSTGPTTITDANLDFLQPL